MSETLRLLKFDPAVALLVMANNHLNIRLHQAFVDLGVPEVLNDSGQTKVTISTKESTDRGIRRLYSGQLDYVYNRIHVASVFAGTVLTVSPPVTIAGAMKNVALATGLVISQDDFVNELVEGDRFVLKAKPESLRWYGETTVMLNEPGLSIQLAEAFPNNVLNGLIPPVFS